MLEYKPRLGVTKKNLNNQKMTVIAYRKSDDIDVRFEDGTVINTSWNEFERGLVLKPRSFAEAFNLTTEIFKEAYLKNIMRHEKTKTKLPADPFDYLLDKNKTFKEINKSYKEYEKSNTLLIQDPKELF